MSRFNLAICDGDKLYCQRMDAYLRGNLDLGFDIFSFTDFEILEKFISDTKISLLMISESFFSEIDKFKLSEYVKNVLVLDEGYGGSSQVMEEGPLTVRYINKYQPACGVVDGIISFCTEEAESFSGLGIQAVAGKGKVIGFYSPLSRCGQTTMAVHTAEKLAMESKVVFLSFESFSGLPQMLKTDSNEDISDLMYYLDCESQKFGLYLERIKKTINGVDYIMPAKTAMQIKGMTYEKVTELFARLIKEGGYDYLIVDLTEYPEDFFDIAALCHKIFTITRVAEADQYKMKMYDEVLSQNELEEIRDKTVKCQIPDIRDKKKYDSFIQALLTKEGLGCGAEI